MFKFFLLTALAAFTLAGPAAPTQTGGTGHMAASQAQMIKIAYPKQRTFKISKTKKRISSTFTRRQCWDDSDISSCKFCRPTYDGYCRCEQHFPCE